MTTNTTVLGFTDIGKVFLHFDDEDAVVGVGRKLGCSWTEAG